MRRLLLSAITFGAVVVIGPLALLVGVIDGFGDDLVRQTRDFEPLPLRRPALRGHPAARAGMLAAPA